MTKQLKRQTLKLIALGASASALTGCFPLVAGGMAGGALVIADRRNPGTQAIDRGIQLEAESFLTKKYGDNIHVNVSVFNRRVLLTGETRTDAIKSSVEADIKNMKNVTTVFNEMVPAPISGLSARANDSYLTTRIKGAFVATEGVPSNSMKVITEASKVYLMGIVTDAEANRAVEIARSVPGVKQVTKVFDLISEADKKRLDGAK
ncbi:BON domain-containing protein [Polynucleobacter sp. MWH-CaK5]|jgi:osmotically-inducible protein OsmY|uniref:BON domain-containing protein n=1 Tax=Polynucleobacter sp. MWH-CaK5 TaxID=2689107 RepID=UPI001BFE3FE8|nr:BON domain-containing protein [Polynucleobacter sp. MWH-CaK5]QWD88950.1 BON domain-containing protein [Polynucleobacter sp. MWH-CaK5]